MMNQVNLAPVGSAGYDKRDRFSTDRDMVAVVVLGRSTLKSNFKLR